MCRDGKAKGEKKCEARIELNHVIVMWIMNVRAPVIVMMKRKDGVREQRSGEARLYTRERSAGDQWRMTGGMMS